MGEIYIFKKELQSWPFEFVISFSEVYFWELGLTFD